MLSPLIGQFTVLSTGVWYYRGLAHRVQEWWWEYDIRSYVTVCKVYTAHQCTRPRLYFEPLTCLACLARESEA